MTEHASRAGWFYGSQVPCTSSPAARSRPYRLVLLGPPGVGKGTQAELLCQRFRTCHLSTGDLFRAAKCEARHSPAMKRALEAMRRGELVPDDIVVDLVRERAACLRCHGGFLLDGFPRTVRQARALEEILDELQVELDAVIAYELPAEEIIARLSGRRTCMKCKTVYHVTARPPRRADVCDQCGGTLVQREDDRPETIRVRLQVYEESTQPLRDYYAHREKLMTISARGTPDDVFRATEMSLLHTTRQVRAVPKAMA